MTVSSSAGLAEAAHLDVHQDPDGALVVRVAGAWAVGQSLPSPDVVVTRLAAHAVPALRYEATGLGAWDTTLLVFTRAVEAAAAAQRVTTDRSGLPGGLQRLLTLIESTPVRRATSAHDPDPAFVEQVGLTAIAAGAWLRGYTVFLGEVMLSMGRWIRRRARFRPVDLVIQVQQAGIEALPVVTLVNFLLGLILAFVGAIQLEMFGASIYVANLVGIAMVRDMAALMTAIVMAGRSGASYAAQIGTMQVNQEVDALETLGISPVDFLVLPRVMALMLMVPLLTLYADVVGVIGGAAVGLGMLHISPVAYYQQTLSALNVGHLLGGLMKAATYGVLVALAGCYQGLHASRSSAGVGEAATTAVVRGIVSIIVACGLFAFLFYVLGW
ncbi:MAG: ABC transporter permease [Gemmatimonadota bacterium]|nr:ABC transporter permease [Gemmatimonadota bacterium]MDH4351365.1 ABC transporter permease [Gemmatimonadota bacterium]MDH5195703.1 ABC transporter permease [Gemmatimonadota bacterium]